MSSGSATDRPGSAASRLTLPGRFGAVIFDLDGVLVDTESGWRRAEAELMRRHGLPYTVADAAASLGAPMDVVVARFARRLGFGATERARLRDELLELARSEYLEVTLVAGAMELVRALRGRVRSAVASNTPRELVLRALDASGLHDNFDVVVTAEDVERPKPAPDIYLAACSRLAIDPSAALAIEDSTPGIQAAHRAGLTVLAIPGGPAVDTQAADHVVSALTEIRVEPH